MSVYYDPTNKKKLNISEMPLPAFAKDYLKYLLNELNLAPRTIFNYSVSITTFLRWVKFVETQPPLERFRLIDVRDMTPEQISEFRHKDLLDFLTFCNDYLNNGPSARSSKIAAIRSMYDYLIKKSDCSGLFEDGENPADDIATPKKEKSLPIFLTVEESYQLLDAVDNKKTGKRDYCMIYWFLSCGMRLTELVSLNTSDIKGGSVRIYGKGRKERLVPLSDKAYEAYTDYILERSTYPRDEDKEALFISPQTGKRVTGRRVEQMLQTYVVKAGLGGNGFSPHKLRHTAATTLYNSDAADILQLKELLGHRSTATTEIYTHLSTKNLQSGVNKSPLEQYTPTAAAHIKEHGEI